MSLHDGIALSSPEITNLIDVQSKLAENWIILLERIVLTGTQQDLQDALKQNNIDITKLSDAEQKLINDYFDELFKDIELKPINTDDDGNIIFDINVTENESLKNDYYHMLNTANQEVVTNYYKMYQNMLLNPDKFDILYLTNQAYKVLDKTRYVDYTSYVDTLTRYYSIQEALYNINQNMDMFNLDLVAVSYHGDASELCVPWQNKVYSRSGTSLKYPPFEPAKWGSGGGLFHPNCRHNVHVFTEGFSTLPKPIDTAKGREGLALRSELKYQERNLRNHNREYNRYKNLADKYKGVDDDKYTYYNKQAQRKKVIVDRWRQKVKNNKYNAYDYV